MAQIRLHDDRVEGKEISLVLTSFHLYTESLKACTCIEGNFSIS